MLLTSFASFYDNNNSICFIRWEFQNGGWCRHTQIYDTYGMFIVDKVTVIVTMLQGTQTLDSFLFLFRQLNVLMAMGSLIIIRQKQCIISKPPTLAPITQHHLQTPLSLLWEHHGWAVRATSLSVFGGLFVFCLIGFLSCDYFRDIFLILSGLCFPFFSASHSLKNSTWNLPKN